MRPPHAALRPDGFLVENARWLGAGVLMSFCSSFGQTFFIALFGPQIRADLDLSHGEWGAIYTLGTIAAAAALSASGGLADRHRVRWLAPATLGLLALGCLLMAGARGWATLALAIFALRFLGQGFSSHLAMSSMGRWFAARRGRALAIAALGFSAGEALLPGAALALGAVMPWRGVWIVAAAFLLCLAPVFLWLLARERRPSSAAPGTETVGMGGRAWTRAQALRHWLFWALAPGLLGPPFIGTAIFFQHAHLIEVKAWAPSAAGGAFALYALCGVGTSFLAAAALDRWGARRLLPVYQAPMAAGAALLAAADGQAALYVAFALAGATQGAATAVLGGVWPEFYGTRFMAGIRAVAISMMVAATALGPGATGLALDAGVGIEAQMAALSLWAAAACAFYGLLAARIRAAASPPAQPSALSSSGAASNRSATRP